MKNTSTFRKYILKNENHQYKLFTAETHGIKKHAENKINASPSQKLNLTPSMGIFRKEEISKDISHASLDRNMKNNNVLKNKDDIINKLTEENKNMKIAYEDMENSYKELEENVYIYLILV